MNGARSCPLLLVLLAGCGPALSSVEPATVPPRGHWRVTTGMDVSIPPGTLDKAVESARTLADVAGERKLEPAEKRALFEGAGALVLNPPSLVPQLAAAYAPLDRFEVGLRYSGAAWRLGGRYQLLRQEGNGVALAAGVGVARFTFEFPVDKILGVVEVEKFSRWQIDLPLVIGRSGSWYRWWAGPRFLWSTYHTGLKLDLPPTIDDVVFASFDGTARYLGGQAGIAVGYRWAFIALELTVAHVAADATLTVVALSASEYAVRDVVFYPSVAIMTGF